MAIHSSALSRAAGYSRCHGTPLHLLWHSLPVKAYVLSTDREINRALSGDTQSDILHADEVIYFQTASNCLRSIALAHLHF